MRLDLTFRKVPSTGRVKDACGLPLACIVQPFAHTERLAQEGPGGVTMDALPRCSSCYAYINCHCPIAEEGFQCSLCGKFNSIPARVLGRYSMGPGVRESLPELRSHVYEVHCEPSGDAADGGAAAAAASPSAAPVVVALVDAAGGEDFLHTASAALAAALEALPPGARFGLITFDEGVTLHDVAGPAAHVLPVAPGAPLPAPFEDVLPLEGLLTPVAANKDAILQVLESLSAEGGAGERLNNGGAASTPPPSAAREGEEAPQQRMRRGGAPRHRRALGPALQGTIEYLRGVQSLGLGGPHPVEGPTPWLGAPRLLVFLSGPPDVQPGQIAPPSPTDPDADPDHAAPSPPRPATTQGGGGGGGGGEGAARAFYEQAGLALAALGVCCDVYAIAGPRPVGLALMEPLANATGGALYLYPSLEEAALPLDVYRRLSLPLASQGLLRVRCCPQLRVLRAYGRLFADEAHQGLFRVIACDAGDAFLVELEHASAAGFDDPAAGAPTLQVAFQYSAVVAAVKTIRAAGVRAARDVLRDWLAAFALDFHKMCHMRVGAAELAQLPVDLSFEACPPLAPLPRLVHALLRSPLLSAPALSHPDLAAYLQHLWTVLPAGELARAVYPALSAYSDPDHLTAQRLPLCRASLASSPAPIFLLDAYIVVLVLYREGAAMEDPSVYPPPQGSLLRRVMAGIRQERRVTPHTEVLREGSEAADVFRSLLIDDPDHLQQLPLPPMAAAAVAGGSGAGRATARGGGEDGDTTAAAATAAAEAEAAQQRGAGSEAHAPAPTGLRHFLDHLRAEMVIQLQEEAQG